MLYFGVEFYPYSSVARKQRDLALTGGSGSGSGFGQPLEEEEHSAMLNTNDDRRLRCKPRHQMESEQDVRLVADFRWAYNKQELSGAAA